MFGMLGGTAFAETPTTTAYAGVRDLHAEAAHLAQVGADQAERCVAPGGLCASAVATATDSMQVAVTCAQAAASEGGVDQAVVQAFQRATLDCASVIRLWSSLAQWAVTVANDCTSETMDVCQAAFQAARMGAEQARSCLGAVLPIAGIDSGAHDPMCASAMAMLWRQAEGVLALVSGCQHGSTGFCREAKEIADYGVDALARCVGDAVWLAPADVRPAMNDGSPLPCTAVLDQLLVATNSVIGQVPQVPTQISPTGNDEDCTITLAAPIPTVRTDPERWADMFVPSCSTPESVGQLTSLETPGLAGTGPKCEEYDRYRINSVGRDGKKTNWSKHLGNRNSSKPLKWVVEEKVSDTLGMKITVGAEAEMKVWLAKVKASVSAEVSATRTWDHNINVTAEIPAGITAHLVSLTFTKVVDGYHETRTEDCKYTSLYRKFRAPYKDYWDYWEEPYQNGDNTKP